MSLLVLKLLLTPLGVGLATAVARRWGPSFGGWIVGIPFTSLPVLLFITLDRGTGFGALTATGILAGTASQAAFALAYSIAALRLRWPIALAAGVVAFAAVTVPLNQLQPPPVPGLEIALGAILLGLSAMPRARPVELEREARLVPARVDIAARAVITTAFVVVLTALASRLGPVLAGLLSPFPLYGAVFIVFPHRRLGGAAALSACRGFLWGLFAAAGFAFTASELLPGAGLAVGMLVAITVAMLIQAVTLLVVRRGARVAPAEAAATRE